MPLFTGPPGSSVCRRTSFTNVACVSVARKTTFFTLSRRNSINFVQTLSKYGKQVSYKRSSVWVRNATAPLNWATAETMKMALNLNRVHAPYFELAEMEFKFLRKLNSDKVDHQSSGPCTTTDG